MKLVDLCICKYKAINDNGWVPVGKPASLFGQSHSGKVGVFRALKTSI